MTTGWTPGLIRKLFDISFKPYVTTVISEGFGKDLFFFYFQSFEVDTDLLRMKLILRAQNRTRRVGLNSAIQRELREGRHLAGAQDRRPTVQGGCQHPAGARGLVSEPDSGVSSVARIPPRDQEQQS